MLPPCDTFQINNVDYNADKLSLHHSSRVPILELFKGPCFAPLNIAWIVSYLRAIQARVK